MVSRLQNEFVQIDSSLNGGFTILKINNYKMNYRLSLRSLR